MTSNRNSKNNIHKKKTIEIKGQSLNEVSSLRKYYGCTFYLNDIPKYIEKSIFDNCSFRTKLIAESVKNCTFRNCTFSDGFEIYSGRNCGWNNIPNHLFTLKNNLTALKIYNSKIQSIPEKITRFTNLHTLALRFSNVRDIPLYISELKNLKVLEITNELHFFSSSHKDIYLPEIERVVLDSRTIPPFIYNLKSIKSLTVYDCHRDEEMRFLRAFPDAQLYLASPFVEKEQRDRRKARCQEK